MDLESPPSPDSTSDPSFVDSTWELIRLIALDPPSKRIKTYELLIISISEASQPDQVKAELITIIDTILRNLRAHPPQFPDTQLLVNTIHR